MNKIITLLFVFALGGLSISRADDSKVLVVPTQYKTIEETLKAIADGKTTLREIVVEPGTHEVNVTLPSNITLRGRETARTILTAKDKASPTISISSVAGVTIANFTFINSNFGISVRDSTSVFIQNNVFYLKGGVSDSASSILTLNHAIQLEDNSPVSIINNTFYKNVYAIDGENTVLSGKNNIFASNQSIAANTIDESKFNYSCIHDNQSGNKTAFGANFVAGDPLFVNPNPDGKGSVYDFHLKENSPCINAGETGDNAIADEWDNSVADIGAYGGKTKDSFLYPPTFTVEGPTALGNDIYSVLIKWTANDSYHVSHSTSPGQYTVYYDTKEIIPFSDSASLHTENVAQQTSFTVSGLTPDNSTVTAPSLIEASAYNRSIDLRWNSVEGASGYKVYYGVDDIRENNIEAGNTTSITLSGLVNGSTYQVAVVALRKTTYYFYVSVTDSSGKLTTFEDKDKVQALELGSAAESGLSNTMTAIPEMVEAVPALPNEGCFIATAAYGYYDASEVQVLRHFRDQVLKRYDTGNTFIAWYYRHGPRAAHWLNQHDYAKPLVRVALWPAIQYADFPLSHSLFVNVVFILGLLICVGLLIRFCWIIVSRNKKHEVRS